MPPICPDIGDNAERCAAAVPLAVHLISRPTDPAEPIPRDDILSLKKLAGEGKMEEIKIILGWEINTRALTISLPEAKYVAWTRDISHFLQQSSVRAKTLETNIGRLNHVGFTIPMMRHFLNCLRKLFSQAQNCQWGSAKLTAKVRDDLRLCLDFLSIAREGISINNVIYRKPTHVYHSNACEHGIGGYSLTSGRAWRWEIPVDC